MSSEASSSSGGGGSGGGKFGTGGRGRGKTGGRGSSSSSSSSSSGGGGGGNGRSMNSSSGAHALAAAPSRRPPGPVEDPEGAVCIICAEDIDHLDRLSALGPCGHRDTCSTCALRLRYIHKDLRCPTCNVEAKAMAVLPSRRYGWDAIYFPIGSGGEADASAVAAAAAAAAAAGNAMNAQWPGGS